MVNSLLSCYYKLFIYVRLIKTSSWHMHKSLVFIIIINSGTNHEGGGASQEEGGGGEKGGVNCFLV